MSSGDKERIDKCDAVIAGVAATAAANPTLDTAGRKDLSVVIGNMQMEKAWLAGGEGRKGNGK